MPICKYKPHKDTIYCSTVLYDGRFATSSGDNSIIIYNNKSFKPDFQIKEHTDPVGYILQISDGMLASCSDDKTIKIFYIKNNNYKLMQTLNYHNNMVNKIIELSNQKLVSCSSDSQVITYHKDNNNKYIKDFAIAVGGICGCLINTKENEICYYVKDYNNNQSICFYDIGKKKFIRELNEMSVHGWNSFNMITKDLLLIAGLEKLTIVNINHYIITRIVNSPDSSYFIVSCNLNRNMILTGDSNNNIKQWEIEGNNLRLISTKENVHNIGVSSLLKLGEGHILSGSYRDGEIIIW